MSFYIWIASSHWRTVNVFWDVTLGNCFSPMFLWYEQCFSVLHLWPPPLLYQTICSSGIYYLYITEHVLQKSCLEVFALLCLTLLAHKGVIYISSTHPSGFCLDSLGSFKRSNGGVCWRHLRVWIRLLSCLLMALLVVSVPVVVYIALCQLWYHKLHLLWSWKCTACDKKKCFLDVSWHVA